MNVIISAIIENMDNTLSNPSEHFQVLFDDENFKSIKKLILFWDNF